MGTKRKAATLVEILLALSLLAVVLGIAWTLLRQGGRAARRVEATHAAVLAAELALGALGSDLAAMLPPDPASGRVPYRVGREGRALAFFKVEAEGDAMVARPLVYEARPTPAGHGNLQLWRNGRAMNEVLLSEFKVTELRVEGGGSPATPDLALPRSLALNPRLELVVEGLRLDRPAAGEPPEARHRLTRLVPIPGTSPASTLGLPREARDLAQGSVRVEGELPDL